MPECNLPLPCSSTCSDQSCADAIAFAISNPLGHAIRATGAITGVVGVGGIVGVQGQSETGTAGEFAITGASNNSPALSANTSGGGEAIRGQIPAPGTGSAGIFAIANPNNTSTALFAETIGGGAAIRGENRLPGTGSAGVFNITNPGNNSTALSANTSGGGTAIGGVIIAPGTGSAGVFRIANPSNNSEALLAQTIGGGAAIRGEIGARGTGSAASFSIENPESFSPVVTASTRGGGAGLFSAAPNGTGIIVFGGGGLIVGNVDVVGTLTATEKNFVIDHPLDPENRSLAHASVESSERANVYSGNASLDDNGEAWVELPAWLEALNADFRYQLTCIGQYAPVYVAEELANSRFKIAGGKAGMKVSWQLTGIRKDLWAQAHPLVVEEEKPANERGSYRHPELYDQPQERDVLRARYADMLEGLPPETLSR